MFICFWLWLHQLRPTTMFSMLKQSTKWSLSSSVLEVKTMQDTWNNFSTFLANIDASHPGASDLIKRGAYSVARSFIPGNKCDTDKQWRKHLCGMPSHAEVPAAVLRELLEFLPTTKHIRDGFGQLVYGHSMLMQLSAWKIWEILTLMDVSTETTGQQKSKSLNVKWRRQRMPSIVSLPILYWK